MRRLRASLKTRIATAWLLAGTAMLCAQAAWAKKVQVEWGELEGAIGYEIELENEGKLVRKGRVKEGLWASDVPPGLYFYRIRGIDRFKRPGQWSEQVPLVVMPPEPTLSGPPAGTDYKFFDPRSSVKLRWNPVPGVTKFRLEVRRGGQVILNQYVQGVEYTLPQPATGQYEWRVAPVIEALGRAPASMSGKKWEGQASDSSSFDVEHKKLLPPQLLYPRGVLGPPKNRVISFKWDEVEGAQGYEIQILPNKPGKAPKLLKSASNTLKIVLPEDGVYGWKVRALASIDANKVAGVVGPQSTANFDLNTNANFKEGGGYVALSTMIAPYEYRVTSPSTSSRGSAESIALTGRFSGEYWLLPQLGFAVGYESSIFTMAGRNFSMTTYELTAKTRFSVGMPQSGWVVQPKAGVESRSIPFITPRVLRSASLEPQTASILGVAVGTDIRKQFTQKLSLGTKISYFIPLSLAGVGGTISESASYRCLSIGAQGIYWLAPQWGAAAGILMDKRSISYIPSGQSASDELYMDANYFFGSLIYVFR